jgi:hypothetical protein
MPDTIMSTTALGVNDLGQGDAEEVAWLVIESIASLNDTVSAVVSVTRLLKDLGGALDDSHAGVVANPFFIRNGHDGPSPGTRKYLRNRSLKSLGGSLVGTIGGMATPITVVNAGGIAQHGNALATTSVHWYRIRAAGAAFRRSQTITRWVDALIYAKSAKAGVRSAGLAGSAIPVPGVSLGAGVVTTLAKLGIKLTLGKLIARTAMEVHWRSYQELILGRGIGGKASGACGPASAMMYEIFTKRGATRVFGKHDTEKLIREPGGWIALNDKLMLM